MWAATGGWYDGAGMEEDAMKINRAAPRTTAITVAGGREEGSAMRSCTDRRWNARCVWIAAVMAMLLILQPAAFGQAPGVQSQGCLGESDAIALSAAPMAPHVLFEIELSVLNKTAAKIHLDPGKFAVLSDQGDQATPLTSDQAKSIIYNPSQSLWSGFWFGYLGYAANASKQAELMKRVDAKILTATDVQPGIAVKGSLFFKPPTPKARQFVLVVDGLSSDTGALDPLHVNCAYPSSRSSQTAAAPPAVRTYSLALRAASGPITMSVSRIEFAQDATSVVVVIENSSDTDADLFFAKPSTYLTDTTGKSYALRSLRTEIGDRVNAHGAVRGTLVFQPLAHPELTTSVTLTMPDIRVGDATYEIKADVRL
jgi:hypothetical protein